MVNKYQEEQHGSVVMASGMDMVLEFVLGELGKGNIVNVVSSGRISKV